MNKIPPKSVKAAPAKQGNVLYCESDIHVITEQSKIFAKAGYEVVHALGRAAAEQALRNGKYDVVVLGHTLTKDDRHHLPYMAKKLGDARVLVLHNSGKHPAVDFALDSRTGDKAVLEALASLVHERLAVAS